MHVINFKIWHLNSTFTHYISSKIYLNNYLVVTLVVIFAFKFFFSSLYGYLMYLHIQECIFLSHFKCIFTTEMHFAEIEYETLSMNAENIPFEIGSGGQNKNAIPIKKLWRNTRYTSKRRVYSRILARSPYSVHLSFSKHTARQESSVWICSVFYPEIEDSPLNTIFPWVAE